MTTPYARRTPSLRGLLEKLALALGGRPGACLAGHLAVAASRTTLLRLDRALPVPEPATVTVVGVDDFAFRKGSTYGSIVVDMDTHRPAGTASPLAVAVNTPKPRHVTGWIIRTAAERTARENADLTRILNRCETLQTLNYLVSDFGGMLRRRQGQHLDSWITDAQASGITALAGFAAGPGKDYDAVRNGITPGWSSGAVEGHVSRLRTIKRQMYRRANFDLLRCCVLLAD